MEKYVCSVCGATSENKKIKHYNEEIGYLCSKHYMQMYRYGKITDSSSRTTQDKNEYILHDTYVEMVLRDKKQNITGKSLLDLEDIEKCKPYKWSLVDGYVISKIKGKNTRIHKFILNYTGSDEIDHINRNKLDNRKENLRIVPRCINASNNGSLGVRQRGHKWEAYFYRFGKYYKVGLYWDKEEAINARAKAIKSFDDNSKDLEKEFIEKRKNKYVGIVPAISGRWIAEFWRNNKKHYIGTFDTEKEAIVARKKALEKYSEELNGTISGTIE